MASRTAASGATTAKIVDARAQRRPDDLRGPPARLPFSKRFAATSCWKRWRRRRRNCCARPDSAVSLPKVTEQIGLATGVDRTHILLIDAAGGDGRVIAAQPVDRARHYDAAGIPEYHQGDGEGRAQVVDHQDLGAARSSSGT